VELDKLSVEPNASSLLCTSVLLETICVTVVLQTSALEMVLVTVLLHSVAVVLLLQTVTWSLELTSVPQVKTRVFPLVLDVLKSQNLCVTHNHTEIF